MTAPIKMLQRTTTNVWPIAPRLIAGLPLLVLGAKHFVDPEHFRSILVAAQAPMIPENMIAAPVAEVAAGALLLLGLFTRVGGLLGVATMLPAMYSTLVVMKLDPAALPPGLSHVPFVPPLPLPIAVLVCSLLAVWAGGGRLSVDALAASAAPPTPEPSNPAV
ncbi:MAG: DoxX family membrane protein [Planctomycetia bacterium]